MYFYLKYGMAFFIVITVSLSIVVGFILHSISARTKSKRLFPFVDLIWVATGIFAFTIIADDYNEIATTASSKLMGEHLSSEIRVVSSKFNEINKNDCNEKNSAY
jgi:hypothetical protein